jgi:hypothetical protein
MPLPPVSNSRISTSGLLYVSLTLSEACKPYTYILGCLGKVPPNRSQGHVTDYIIQHEEAKKEYERQKELEQVRSEKRKAVEMEDSREEMEKELLKLVLKHLVVILLFLLILLIT